MSKRIVVLAWSMLILFSASAFAAEHFGVPIYPGARTDADTKEYCDGFRKASVNIVRNVTKQNASAWVYCYRTSDAFPKVLEFYKKQKGLNLVDLVERPSSKTAMLCTGDITTCAAVGAGADVNVSSPWTNKTGHNDVMISIRKMAK